jgi:hypothetical protein
LTVGDLGRSIAFYDPILRALGKGVRGFRLGERVGYSLNVPGAYAEERVLQAGDLIKLAVDAGYDGIAVGTRCGRGDVVPLIAAALAAGLEVPVVAGVLS